MSVRHRVQACTREWTASSVKGRWIREIDRETGRERSKRYTFFDILVDISNDTTAAEYAALIQNTPRVWLPFRRLRIINLTQPLQGAFLPLSSLTSWSPDTSWNPAFLSQCRTRQWRNSRSDARRYGLRLFASKNVAIHARYLEIIAVRSRRFLLLRQTQNKQEHFAAYIGIPSIVAQGYNRMSAIVSRTMRLRLCYEYE